MSDRDADEPLGIGVKDGIGLAFIMIAACGAAFGYKTLGIAWSFGFALLGCVGLLFLWSAKRDRRLQLWMFEDACKGDAANYDGAMSDGGSVFDDDN